jgi:hypothetical protein
METLAGLLLVALEIVVQLGVPVVVIFVMGYTTHRANRRRFDPCRPDHPQPHRPNRALARPAAAGAEGQQGCQLHVSPAAQTVLPFPPEPALPCWQAVKTVSGRLRNECLECRAFLSQPAPR